MIFKKITIVILTLSFLNGCAQNVTLLGPAYTLATTGNIYQAGFTYGSNEIITKTTGKSVTQNLRDTLALKKKDTGLQN